MSEKTNPCLPILLVDDDPTILKTFEIALETAGYYNLISCSDSLQAPDLLLQQEMCLILLDLNMPGISGQQLLEHIMVEYPEIPVIVVTGNYEVETAVQCMKQGAFDYLVKPVRANRLISIVRRTIEMRDLKRENLLLKRQILDNDLAHPEAFLDIITNSPRMRSIFKYAEYIAPSPQPLLITGETGVGKEIMARVVHNISRRKGECVTVNVAGIDDNSFSDTLFGHIRGAFTGAEKPRPGLVDKAAGGSLILDEIGDLGKESQVKLLRLIQEGEYYPLGSDTPKLSNARIIVSTNKNLASAQEQGLFRKDLYYRLQSHCIELPPLRDRTEDIGLLLQHFIDESSSALKKQKPSFPEQLVDLLEQYSFPGNIRELRAMVYDAVSTVPGKSLSLDIFYAHMGKHRLTDLPDTPQKESGKTKGPLQLNGPLPTLKEANRFLIQEALRQSKNNQSMAARLLGISRQTLARNLQNESKG